MYTQVEEYMLVYTVAKALGKSESASRILAQTHVSYLEEKSEAIQTTWDRQ